MSCGGGYDTNEFVATYYDHIPGYRDRGDVGFYVDEATQSEGSVLEVCCGTGRLLVPIARKDIEVTGIDLSPYMLGRCRDKLKNESARVRSRVRLVESDMRDFELDQKFSLAFIAFRSFQHLTTPADQRACLETIRRHLQPGGRLILDLFNPNLEYLAADNVGVESPPDSEFTMPDGTGVLRSQRLVSKNLADQINNVEFIYRHSLVDGSVQKHVHAFPMRYLYRYEVEHLLARCGFNIIDVYSDFSRAPYGPGYPREIIVEANRSA